LLKIPDMGCFSGDLFGFEEAGGGEFGEALGADEVQGAVGEQAGCLRASGRILSLRPKKKKGPTASSRWAFSLRIAALQDPAQSSQPVGD